MSTAVLLRNKKSAFRMILGGSFYAVSQVEKSVRIWYFIITKGDSHRRGKALENSSIQNLRKERLTKDVSYQEHRKLTLDCRDRKVRQSRVIFFLPADGVSAVCVRSIGQIFPYTERTETEKERALMEHTIVWVRDHVEVYDYAGQFCFSADSHREALEELSEAA